jgi:hypothetical protein
VSRKLAQIIRISSFVSRISCFTFTLPSPSEGAGASRDTKYASRNTRCAPSIYSLTIAPTSSAATMYSIKLPRNQVNAIPDVIGIMEYEPYPIPMPAPMP